jgi:hypothetical protein
MGYNLFLHSIITARFFVDSLKGIEWSDTAFENLVLPLGHKDLILGFAEGQLQYKNTFNDVIQGKGEKSMNVRIILKRHVI